MSFADSLEGVYVDFSGGADYIGGGGEYGSIEGAVGSGQDDTIVGGAGANRLDGGGGNDVLRAGAGRGCAGRRRRHGYRQL